MRAFVATQALTFGAYAWTPKVASVARLTRRQESQPLGFCLYAEPPTESDEVTEEDVKDVMCVQLDRPRHDSITLRSRGLTLADLNDVDPDAVYSEIDAQPVPEGALSNEAQTKANAAAEWIGDFDGRDDDLDAPWRQEAEALIMSAASEEGVEIQDIMWDLGTLRLTVASDLDAEDISRATRAIINSLEAEDERLRILDRHNLEVSSPGTPNVLSRQLDFETFKGFDVIVATENPVPGGENRELTGKLVERNSVDLIISQKGRMVRIPYYLVEEVRLVPAKTEK